MKVMLTVQSNVNIGVLGFMAALLVLFVRHPRVIAIRYGAGSGFRNASQWAAVCCVVLMVFSVADRLISPY